MKRWLLIPALASCLFIPMPQRRQARAEDLPPKYKAVVNKGLQWLIKQQNRDGHWEANGGQFASAMTAMAGTVLLMEGSTIREGKYADNIRRACDFLMNHVQRNGLIGDPNANNMGLGYMYGHGFSILSCRRSTGKRKTPTAGGSSKTS